MYNTIEKENQHPTEATYFTYHKQSAYSGFIGAMIFVAILETAGVSYFLYNWSPIVHWIHLILGVATIVFLILDLRAVIKNPIVLKNEELTMRIGIRPKVVFELKQIKEIKKGSINYENDRKGKDVLDLSLLGFDEPTYEIVLHNPIQYKGLFGTSSDITRIFFSVDDQNTFYSMIQKNES